MEYGTNNEFGDVPGMTAISQGMMIKHWVLGIPSFWTKPVFFLVYFGCLECFVWHLWDDGAWVDDIEYLDFMSNKLDWRWSPPIFFLANFKDFFMLSLLAGDDISWPTLDPWIVSGLLPLCRYHLRLRVLIDGGLLLESYEPAGWARCLWMPCEERSLSLLLDLGRMETMYKSWNEARIGTKILWVPPKNIWLAGP